MNKEIFPAYADLIGAYNFAVEILERQKLKSIPFVKGEPGSDVEQMICSYGLLTQSFLQRISEQAEEYSRSINELSFICAATLGRALLESIALLHHFLNEFERKLNNNDVPEAYHLLGSITLTNRMNYELEQGQSLKKINILDAIRNANKTSEGFEKSYNFLSEFAHPNSVGTAVSFSKMDSQNNMVLFGKFYDVSNPSPVLEPAGLFFLFAKDWGRFNGLEELIRVKFRPCVQEIRDLFLQEIA